MVENKHKGNNAVGKGDKIMCKFFSLVSDGNGKIMYFDWEIKIGRAHV